MTEKRLPTPNNRYEEDEVKSEKSISLLRRRAGYTSNVTKLTRLVKELMSQNDSTCRREIEVHLKSITGSIRSLEQITQELIPLLSEEKQEEVKVYCEIRVAENHELMTEYEEWAQNKDSGEVNSSEENAVEARQALAKIKLQQIEAQFQIERERMELTHRAELMKAQTELEVARLEASLSTNVRLDSIKTSTPHQKAGGYQDVSFTPVRNEKATRIQYENQQPKLNPYAAEFQSRPSDMSMNEAYLTMASAIRESVQMPKPEILTFNGDPCEYFRFINMFRMTLKTGCPIMESNLVT